MVTLLVGSTKLKTGFIGHRIRAVKSSYWGMAIASWADLGGRAIKSVWKMGIAMINLENGKMSVDGEHWYPIERWEVWFMTPFGVCKDLGPSVRMVKQRDHDPDMTIVPVCVAISQNNDVEIVRR